MKKFLPLVLILAITVQISFGQAASVPIQTITTVSLSNATATNILNGTYTPLTYNAATVQSIPDSIMKGLITKINPDSIKAYFLKLGSFYNRNSGNQAPVDPSQGITASVNWVNSKFQEFSAANSNRLIVSDINFTIPLSTTTCSKTTHKEPIAIIPGSSNADKSILVFTAHIDSRGGTSCTGEAFEARGMEDNATGVAALMELARVMSQYSYNRTIVFIMTTLEEQSLGGATAFVKYCQNNSIPVRANINNDQMGTMICLTPSSQPGCSANNTFDTTNIRIFSSQNPAKTYAKQWARYIKLAYKDKALPTATVPMTINLMAGLDRNGRGGDHMAFDTANFPAVRLMCANEAGDGSGTSRIHTSLDIGGKDRNNDGVIDSFYVGFNYMQRNAMIDGIAMALAAEAQTPPTYSVTNLGNNNIKVTILTQTGYPFYRIGVRTTNNDFDSVYKTSTLTTTLLIPVSGSGRFYISVAGLDAQNVTTFFGAEANIASSLTTLAVNYVAFTATKKTNVSELKFTIAQPVTGSVFYIERSTDGKNFKTIDHFNSINSTVSYSYIDSFPEMNNINYYRIREIDNNAATSYSSIRNIKYIKEELIKVFPVPAFTSFTVVFTDVLNQKPNNMVLYNDMGQMVYVKNLYGTKGKEVVDVNELRNGTYIIKITTAHGTVNKTIQVIR